ncbi:hypothetical protein VTP01DRAFT_7611 [Rhizomucor pusillus]|uniref:uncharacterized protein n=1 Tax=Rhizomucor pusillus TaxID=4840 RepID=UPI00374347FC
MLNFEQSAEYPILQKLLATYNSVLSDYSIPQKRPTPLKRRFLIRTAFATKAPKFSKRDDPEDWLTMFEDSNDGDEKWTNEKKLETVPLHPPESTRRWFYRQKFATWKDAFVDAVSTCRYFIILRLSQ